MLTGNRPITFTIFAACKGICRPTTFVLIFLSYSALFSLNFNVSFIQIAPQTAEIGYSWSNFLAYFAVFCECSGQIWSSFKRSWDDLGHQINLGSPWIRPRSVFSIIFTARC